MSYDEIVSSIKVLTEKDKKNITQRSLKLCEESGEVAAAILSLENAPGCEYKTLGRDDSTEECVDVLIVAFSLLSQLKASDEEVYAKFSKKLSKWEMVCSP